MWEAIAIAAGCYAAFASYGLAMEMVTDAMSDWRDAFDKKVEPIRDAYRAHIWVCSQLESMRKDGNAS